MNAKELYSQLEQDFIKPGMSDEWAEHMSEVSEYLSENFKKRSMGLVCDFSEKINKVYTAVFPSEKVMKEILAGDAENALLFVHHPSIWNIRKAPQVFQQMNKELLEEFKKRKISIYNLHVPLDDYGEYSTSFTLAEALNIQPEKAFGKYFGALCGVYGKAPYSLVSDLKKTFEEQVGHAVKVYNYGGENIKNNVVALIGGGGNSIDLLEEIAKDGVNILVTGITAKNSHSQKAHDYAKQKGITLVGGTHHSTEKFACQKMTEYFKKQGLESKYIEDEPVLEDM